MIKIKERVKSQRNLDVVFICLSCSSILPVLRRVFYQSCEFLAHIVLGLMALFGGAMFVLSWFMDFCWFVLVFLIQIYGLSLGFG